MSPGTGLTFQTGHMPDTLPPGTRRDGVQERGRLSRYSLNPMFPYRSVRYRTEQTVSWLSSRWAQMSNGILIADDSAAVRRIIRAYLVQRNFEVCGEAVDGVDALEKATKLEPALILLDLRMPRMNGVEAASVLKSRMPKVHIVLLTMYDEVANYKSLMSAIGIDAIVSKPAGFSGLADCVRGLLDSAPAPPATQT